MKKLVLFLIITIGFFTVHAQNEDTLELISRKWKIESVSDRLYDRMDSAAKEDSKTAMVVFTQDGKYSSFIRNIEVDSGRWIYVPATRKLVCTSTHELGKTILIISGITKYEMKGRGFEHGEKEGLEFTFSAIK